MGEEQKTKQQQDTSASPAIKPTDIGTNRTGVSASPIDKRRLVEASEATQPGMTNGHSVATEREAIGRNAGPVGTVPPPMTVKGVVKTVVQGLKGQSPNVLLDKLGERLAFERTGTRLYDALLVKFDLADVHEGGPTRSEIERIRDDEHRHFLLVKDAIEKLGGDPTAMTPCADIIAVAGLGWIQVLGDPRTTLTQCLDVILVAELADADGWMMLVGLAESLNLDELAATFRIANAQEEEHVQRVRGWLQAAVHGQAGAEPPPTRLEAEPPLTPP